MRHWANKEIDVLVGITANQSLEKLSTACMSKMAPIKICLNDAIIKLQLINCRKSQNHFLLQPRIQLKIEF